MKKFVRSPEVWLLIVGFFLVGAGLLLSIFWRELPFTAKTYYVSDSEKAALVESGHGEEYKININTASKELLQKVDGIGEATAQNIVEYREQHGSFESLADLVSVYGIGPVTLKNISPYLTCE